MLENSLKVTFDNITSKPSLTYYVEQNDWVDVVYEEYSFLSQMELMK